MLSSELSLIPTMPIGTVTVLDGSFASHDPNEAADILSSEPFVVACPKSDSHQRLWHECGLVGTALPDKVLAALLLDEGEMLLGDRDFPATDDNTDLTTIPVAHLRPFGATTAVTVETSPLLDVFERREVLNVVAADCHPPFTQEPVVQYVTDLFAKDISAIARAQMETARLDAAEHGLDLSSSSTPTAPTTEPHKPAPPPHSKDTQPPCPTCLTSTPTVPASASSPPARHRRSPRDLIGNERVRSVNGHMVVLRPIDAQGRTEIARGTVTKVEVSNRYHEDKALRGVIALRGGIGNLTARGDVKTATVSINSAFREENGRLRPIGGALSFAPNTGEAVVLAEKETVDRIASETTDDLFYLGTIYRQPHIPPHVRARLLRYPRGGGPDFSALRGGKTLPRPASSPPRCGTSGWRSCSSTPKASSPPRPGSPANFPRPARPR